MSIQSMAPRAAARAASRRTWSRQRAGSMSRPSWVSLTEICVSSCRCSIWPCGLEVVLGDGVGLGHLGDVLAEAREDGRDAVLLAQRVGRIERVVQPLAGHEALDGLAEHRQPGRVVPHPPVLRRGEQHAAHGVHVYGLPYQTPLMQAAVDLEDRTGRVGRGVRQQERRRLAELVGGAVAAERESSLPSGSAARRG